MSQLSVYYLGRMKEDVCERDVAKVAEMKRESKWPGPVKDSTAGFLDVERNKLISVESSKTGSDYHRNE